MRLARAGCGSVSYWMELPVSELARYLIELVDQLEDEREAQESAAKGR
jgi:hypothetical protein